MSVRVMPACSITGHIAFWSHPYLPTFLNQATYQALSFRQYSRQSLADRPVMINVALAS